MYENSHSEPTWAAPRSVEDLGHYLAAVRRVTGRTQADIAAAAGVPRRFVNELEGGHTTLYVDRLVAVLAELGVRVRLEAGPPAPATRTGEAHVAITLRGGAVGEVPSPVKDLGW